jgi:hypothetical protein
MSQATTRTLETRRHALDSSHHHPILSEELLQGYLQISLSGNGTLQVRGTRSLMDWLSKELANDGWCVHFEDIRWCG